MRIYDFPQGSAEWLESRCGIPSASNFDKIVTLSGEKSKQRKKYMYQVAGERITKKPELVYSSIAMQRGTEMESEARKFYELTNGVEVKQVGFCTTEGTYIYGCSPDGLINDDGLIEIKCPLISNQVSYMVDGNLWEEYYRQVQGQLLVTGRKWCDLISYYPGLKPIVLRIKPDDTFQKTLKNEVELFCAELELIVTQIK